MTDSQYIGFRDDLPAYSPARPVRRNRPLAAARHFMKVVADKEDTAAVFHVYGALPWKELPAVAERFTTDPRLIALRKAEPCLPAILDDHATLRKMPAGSLAQVYCDFMESEGLSAQGLVDEHNKFSDVIGRHDDVAEWIEDRSRDTHDLLHILTGYGRDALGEASVLAFTYGQEKSYGHLALAYPLGLTIMAEQGLKAPVLGAIREAQRNGMACKILVEQSILSLLPMPIDEVRRHLNVLPATKYQECHRIWRANDIDPYAVMAPKAA